jgi:hypothetical protein
MASAGVLQARVRTYPNSVISFVSSTPGVCTAPCPPNSIQASGPTRGARASASRSAVKHIDTHARWLHSLTDNIEQGGSHDAHGQRPCTEPLDATAQLMQPAKLTQCHHTVGTHTDNGARERAGTHRPCRRALLAPWQRDEGLEWRWTGRQLPQSPAFWSATAPERRRSHAHT